MSSREIWVTWWKEKPRAIQIQGFHGLCVPAAVTMCWGHRQVCPGPATFPWASAKGPGCCGDSGPWAWPAMLITRGSTDAIFWMNSGGG